jgi:hypothetical protein
VYIYSKESSDSVIKAFYIEYYKILNTVIQKAKKQHCNRLMTKPDNKIGDWKNTCNKADALSSSKL